MPGVQNNWARASTHWRFPVKRVRPMVSLIEHRARPAPRALPHAARSSSPHVLARNGTGMTAALGMRNTIRRAQRLPQDLFNWTPMMRDLTLWSRPPTGL